MRRIVLLFGVLLAVWFLAADPASALGRRKCCRLESCCASSCHAEAGCHRTREARCEQPCHVKSCCHHEPADCCKWSSPPAKPKTAPEPPKPLPGTK
jgi:hypothetical protein